MVELFNSMSGFELFISTLIALALLLEIISFWKTNKKTNSILDLKNITTQSNFTLKEFNEKRFIEPMKEFKKLLASSRKFLIVYIIVFLVITLLYNNIILISLSFLLLGVGISKYLFYKKMYKEFYNIYLEINDIEKV